MDYNHGLHGHWTVQRVQTEYREHCSTQNALGLFLDTWSLRWLLAYFVVFILILSENLFIANVV